MTSGNGPAPPSRARLLEAGLDLFHELPLATLWAGLSVSEVSRAAGVTRATFYANWPTQEDFVADLVRHNEDRARVDVSDEVLHAVTELGARNDDVVAALREVLRLDFERYAADRDLRLELALVAKADDPVIAAPVRELFGQLDAELAAGYELVLHRWQREPRPPLTLDDVATILDAVLHGMLFRHWFDPQRGRVELFEEAVLALVPVLTRRIGDPQTLEDLHAEIDRFVDVGPRVPDRATTVQAFDLPGLLSAVRRLLADRGWAELGLADVAAVSGASEDDLLERFGSKAGLATILLAHLTAEALDRTDLPVEPVARLQAMIGWLTSVIDAHPELCFGAVAVATGLARLPDMTLAPDPTMRRVIADAIRDGQAAGALRPDVDADAFTEVFVRTLLIERISPGTTGMPATELLLEGLWRSPQPPPSATGADGAAAGVSRRPGG